MPFAIPRPACLLSVALLLACGSANAGVFINEVHYDNAGTDSGEGVEVVATGGESLSGYRLYLYNGSSPGNAKVYGDKAVPAGSTVNCGGSVRVASLSWPSNGLQNGSNDAIALVDGSGNVVQFLAYEGSVTGGNGPASGLTSDVIPVSETGSTPAGTSLQLQGSGSDYDDFSWAGSAGETFGACNAGQSFDGGGGDDPDPDPAPVITSTTPADG